MLSAAQLARQAAFLSRFDWVGFNPACNRLRHDVAALWLEPWRWQALNSPDRFLPGSHLDILQACSLRQLLVPPGLQPGVALLDAVDARGLALFQLQQPEAAFRAALAYPGSPPLQVASVHGVLLAMEGVGVLLTGESGAGKSELALELLNRGASLVADDAPEVRQELCGRVNGRCPPLLQGFLEVQGLGVLAIEPLFGVDACCDEVAPALVVELLGSGQPLPVAADRLVGNRGYTEILGVPLPLLQMQHCPGRDLATRVQVAARQARLLASGVDSVTEFRLRHAQAMDSSD